MPRRRGNVEGLACVSNNARGRSPAARPVYGGFFFWIPRAAWRPRETGTQSEPAM